MTLADPLWLTIKLAAVTTPLLLLLGTPIAWWLARSRSPVAAGVEALVSAPLVLPPSVLGFYLLIALAPDGIAGRSAAALGLGPLSFTFTGLVIGSLAYSFPFVVRPLQVAFAQIDPRLLEAAATMGAAPADRFRSMILPMSRNGFLTAATLAFAHTVGEFGVVLMIGGNIPGQTRVLSIEIYDAVERIDYATAHTASAGLLAFSVLSLLAVALLNRRGGAGW